MANRILSFSYQPPAKSSLLVYADLDLNASYAPITFKPVHQLKNSMHYLSADVGDGSKFDRDDEDFVLQENEDRILLFDHSNRTDAENVQYNKEQRKKSPFKLEKDINVNAVKQSIRNIFSWIPGERIINPEFGSKLRSYLYNGITDYNNEAIMAEIRNCFTTWEPRAQLERVVNVSTVADTEDNTVQLEIIYSIPSLSKEQYSYTVEVQKSV